MENEKMDWCRFCVFRTKDNYCTWHSTQTMISTPCEDEKRVCGEEGKYFKPDKETAQIIQRFLKEEIASLEWNKQRDKK